MIIVIEAQISKRCDLKTTGLNDLSFHLNNLEVMDFLLYRKTIVAKCIVERHSVRNYKKNIRTRLTTLDGKFFMCVATKNRFIFRRREDIASKQKMTT